MAFDRFDHAGLGLRQRLAAYLAGRGIVGPIGPLAALPGGRASGLFAVTSPPDGPAVVLKTYPANDRGRATALREWQAITRLHAVGRPVPRGVLHEPDARHLGHPFVVMERVPGVSFWRVHEAAVATTRARLVRSFVAQLVALHALDPAVLAPVVLDDPLDRELADLHRDRVLLRNPPPVEVLRWLERHAVPGTRPVIQHRDFHPWNVLVDGAERLSVIDWDWRVGDPLFDLAWTGTLMRRDGHGAFADAVEAEYVRQTGRPLDDLPYFEVVATTRWLLHVLPAMESAPAAGSPLDGAAAADFRAFLAEPVRRAREFLHERTGCS